MQVGAMRAERKAEEAATGPSPQLVRAAHEFEGQMMQELLKPMTQSGSLGGDGDDSDGGSGWGGALGSFAQEALGQAISNGGGFGIANQIVRQLSHSGNEQHGEKVTSDGHADTVMRISK